MQVLVCEDLNFRILAKPMHVALKFAFQVFVPVHSNQVATPSEYTRELHLILIEINWLNVFIHRNFLAVFALL